MLDFLFKKKTDSHRQQAVNDFYNHLKNTIKKIFSTLH